MVTGCGQPLGTYMDECDQWFLQTGLQPNNQCGIRCCRHGVCSTAFLDPECDNKCQTQADNSISCYSLSDTCNTNIIDILNCYPASSTVRLADGSSKPMSLLAIGDQVLSVEHTTGKLIYSEVYTFFEQKRTSVHQYLAVKLGRLDAAGACMRDAPPGRVLNVSPNHAVYRSRTGRVSFADAHLVHADKLIVGDIMWVVNTEPTVQASCVVAVERHDAMGAYAPHTLAGSIVVDGVASHSVADLTLGGNFMSDILGVPLEWYSKGLAYLRMLYRLGLLSRNGSVCKRVFQSWPVALLYSVAAYYTYAECSLMPDGVQDA